MSSAMLYTMDAVPYALSNFPSVMEAGGAVSCRFVPEDPSWPLETQWNALNSSIGGRLIKTVPLAHVCFEPNHGADACEAVQTLYNEIQPRIDDPASIISAYFTNDSCNPFLADDGYTCTLGNLAPYAINVSDASSVVAGINFARDHNLRLTIKNTGHDFLGRSTGRGALELWTHYLDAIEFSNYSSPHYTGPAVRMGAGIQSFEVSQAAQERGLRVVGGFCPTVGIAGGWLQGGGHGPLGSRYGLGADNVLEFEVVTVNGQHLVATPTQNEDLFWALSGGGPGNFAIALSVTLKAHPDGKVAGAQWIMPNTDNDAFWKVLDIWLKHWVILDLLPGLSIASAFNEQMFILNYASWPDASAEQLSAAFIPFFEEIKDLPVQFTVNETAEHDTWRDHFQYFTQFPYDTHNTNGGRFIPRTLVRDHRDELLSTFRSIVTNTTAGVGMIGGNYTYLNTGASPGSNAVNPPWRDALFSTNIIIEMAVDAPYSVARDDLAQMNMYQDQLRALTPGGGSYMSESTYNNPNWKQDYYGSTYDKLLRIKHKYDPEGILWASVAVASDEVWTLEDDGRLCATTQE
ncbi:FAD-binding domain-containing protein [Xylaria arbuscula]|nr:FAD-binding domain-containing protein [Xylaria arbuscula]